MRRTITAAILVTGLAWASPASAQTIRDCTVGEAEPSYRHFSCDTPATIFSPDGPCRLEGCGLFGCTEMWCSFAYYAATQGAEVWLATNDDDTQSIWGRDSQGYGFCCTLDDPLGFVTGMTIGGTSLDDEFRLYSDDRPLAPHSAGGLLVLLGLYEGDDEGHGSFVEDPAYDETISGHEGDDTLYGAHVIRGGSGADAMHLTSGAAGGEAHGGAGDDLIAGGAGPDLIYGNSGDDVLCAGPPNMGSAPDELHGGLGVDVLWAPVLSNVTGSTGNPPFTTHDLCGHPSNGPFAGSDCDYTLYSVPGFCAAR